MHLKRKNKNEVSKTNRKLFLTSRKGLLGGEKIGDRGFASTLGGIIASERNKNTLLNKYGDGEEAPLCACGCGKPVKRTALSGLHNWNKYVHNHHSSVRNKQWIKNHPSHFSDMGKKAHKNMREKDPLEYFKKQSRIAEEFHRKNPSFASKNSKRTHRMIPDLGRRCYEGRLKNCACFYMGALFDSGEERDIAKLRFEILGIVPTEENCHVWINNREFDFEQLGFIHEHHPVGHPFANPLSAEEYYNQRREILDNNGHKKSLLIVTKRVNEAKKMYMWLSKSLGLMGVK